MTRDGPRVGPQPPANCQEQQDPKMFRSDFNQLIYNHMLHINRMDTISYVIHMCDKLIPSLKELTKLPHVKKRDTYVVCASN